MTYFIWRYYCSVWSSDPLVYKQCLSLQPLDESTYLFLLFYSSSRKDTTITEEKPSILSYQSVKVRHQAHSTAKSLLIVIPKKRPFKALQLPTKPTQHFPRIRTETEWKNVMKEITKRMTALFTVHLAFLKVSPSLKPLR